MGKWHMGPNYLNSAQFVFTPRSPAPPHVPTWVLHMSAATAWSHAHLGLCAVGPSGRLWADRAYHCPRDPTCHTGHAPTTRADRMADLPGDIPSAPTDSPRPLKGSRSWSSSPFPRSHPSTASKDLKHKFEHPINPGNKKVIIFTAFADTANYLYYNLKYLQTPVELTWNHT